MGKYLLSILLIFGFGINVINAQFDNSSNNSVQFQTTENDVVDPSGLELPATKIPSLSKPDNKYNPNNLPKLGEDEPKALNMNEKDGFIDQKTNKTPKYFTKDAEIKEEYGRDQFLGDIKTGTSYVNVVYRDHEYVDGDRIRVYVNEDVVQSDITLDSSFRGFDLTLVPGSNKIDFMALNQGESGPNTAELHIYDDKGVLISAYKWNLLTGKKASILIIKE